ncbi:hypothetical protein ACFE6N_08015 [Pedobacter sp. BG31]|uniref:hypothetical protein n=1 Tax=Pedobacter sp. BG31 TaxID=3349697 RepID=UPI0035F36330
MGVRPKDESVAFYDHADRSISVSILRNGRLSPTLNDSKNFLSVLGHESTHEADDVSGFKETYLSHSTVYQKQILSENFSEATFDFQLGTVGSFANHVYNARYNRENGVNEYVSNFNKISKDWKIGDNVVSGSGYPVYYKGQKYIMPVKMLKNPSE